MSTRTPCFPALHRAFSAFCSWSRKAARWPAGALLAVALVQSAAAQALLAPGVSMRFSPEVIGPYGPVFTTMTITLTNPNAVDITGVVFGQGYPAWLMNSDLPTSRTNCPNGSTKTFAIGDGPVVITGTVELHDATIPAHGSCDLTVDLTAVLPGKYTNTLPAYAVASANAPPAPTAASAVLEVREFPFVLPSPQPVSCSTSGFVFNTAYASDISSKPLNTLDDRWMVGVGGPAGPSSVSTWKPAYVAFPATAAGTWAVSPFSNANWISGRSNASHIGEYVYYRYDFTLAANIDPAAFSLGLDFYGDDGVLAVYANGTVNPFTGAGSYLPGGQGHANVSRGWKPGTNSLIVGTADFYNLTAFMAQARTNTLCARSSVTVKTVSDGGTGVFSYSGNNGFASQSVTTVTPGTAASGKATNLAALNVPTTITQKAPAEFKLAGVSCTGMGVGGTATPSADGSVVLSAAAVVEGGDIVCTFTNASTAPPAMPDISGKVFSDNGAAGGTANDGVLNGAEPGLPGVAVMLSDCAGKTLSTAVTDGNGQYRTAAPADIATGAPLCLEVARSSGRTATGASIGGTALLPGVAFTAAPNTFTLTPDARADRIGFAWTGTPPEGVNFASVPVGSLLQAGLKNGLPGSSVIYGHIFTAGTLGQLTFSVTGSVATPASAGWTELVFADPGCTGSLQPGVARLFPPAVAQTVTAGQVVCVVMQQAIPLQAPMGSHNRATLDAAVTFTNAAPALSASYTLDDVTTVSSDALGLLKEVRNVSQGVTAFGLSNQAKPGDTLEYRVTYTNTAPGPLRGLVINDATPAYTRFTSASVNITPASLTACRKVTPADGNAVDCAQAQKAGGKGALSWTFDGELTPGGSGSVLFRVIVD